MADLSPSEAISQLKTLPPDQQREVLMRVPEERRQEILSSLMSKKPDMAEFKAPATGMARVKEFVNTEATNAAHGIEENLPAIGATVGGLGGSLLGPGGAFLGGTGGAAVAKFLQNIIGNAPAFSGPAKSRAEAIERLKRTTVSPDALQDVGMEAVKQGAIPEIGGLAVSRLGKTIFPTPRSAYLAYGADAGKYIKQVNHVLPDLDQLLMTRGINPGTLTIGGYHDLLEDLGQNLENRYNLAINKVYNNYINTTDIGDAIMNTVTSNLKNTPEGRAEIAYLQSQAANYQHKAWTIGALDEERRKITAELETFHKATKSGQAVDLKTLPEIRAKAAIESKLKDIVYDWADMSGQEPPGFFADLKRKQSGLKFLRDAADAAEERHTESAFRYMGAPWSEKLSLHAHVYPRFRGGIPASLGGYNRLSSGAHDLAKATTQMQRAFPGGATKAARYVRSAIGESMRVGAEREAASGLPQRMVTTARQRAIQKQINAIPLRMLFSIPDFIPEKTDEETSQQAQGSE